MRDEHGFLPPSFLECLWMLFKSDRLRLWLKQPDVFREIHNGMGWVQQELSMERNNNMTKKWAHLSTQQLTIDRGRG